MSDLLVTLQQKTQKLDNIEILTKMGYHKPEKALKRLNCLLTSTNLLWWFNHDGFDLKYSNREFILKLGKIVNIPKAELLAELSAVQKEQIRIEKMFQTYIFIDTNFKRQNQPLFTLALLEGQRHITLSKYDVLKNATDELDRVKHIVRDHYKKSGGQLPFWGKIHRYIYVYGANQKLVIIPDGRAISPTDCQLQKATLTIKGKDISALLKIK